MSTDLYHVAASGRRSRVGFRSNGHLRLDFEELDSFDLDRIFQMFAEIAKDPSKHFHEYGEPDDVKTARDLVRLFIADVDLAGFVRDVETLCAERPPEPAVLFHSITPLGDAEGP